MIILVTKPTSITPVLSLAGKASEKILPVKTITQGKSKPLVENIFSYQSSYWGMSTLAVPVLFCLFYHHNHHPSHHHHSHHHRLRRRRRNHHKNGCHHNRHHHRYDRCRLRRCREYCYHHRHHHHCVIVVDYKCIVNVFLCYID